LSGENGYAAGKVVLITGASRGIGRRLALSLGRQGASVVVNYKKNADLAQGVVDEIEAAGGQGVAIQADMEVPEEIDALFEATKERHGRLDFFIPNAAASSFKMIRDLGVHNLDRSYAMNVRAFVLGSQRAVEMMDRGGRIVTLSSYGSARAYPTYANLGSAKAAIETWVRYMAVEWAPLGVNVNVVSGGVIESDSSEFFYNVEGMPSLERDVLPKIPKARQGTVEEFADIVEFFLEPRSDYITGQTLVVDGGLSIVAPPFFDDATGPLRLPAHRERPAA